MGRKLTISEKHGINPSMGVCFWCGNDDGTVLLIGKIRGDVEAPRRMCIGYEPCDKCKKNWAQGVVFKEARPTPTHDGQAAMNSGGLELYPTGRWLVLKHEAVTRIINSPELLQSILKLGETLVETEVFDMIATQGSEVA